MGEFGSGVAMEVTAFVVVCAALYYLSLASLHDPFEPCSGVYQCTIAMLKDEEYHVRCLISFPIAIMIYLASAATAATLYPRKIAVRGSRPPIASFYNGSADINVSLLGMLSGTPMIQLFHVCNDKYRGVGEKTHFLRCS